MEGKRYKSAPIEEFHGEALKEFHEGAEFKSNEAIIKDIRYINGIEFNRLLARFKVKIMKEYEITQSGVLKELKGKVSELMDDVEEEISLETDEDSEGVLHYGTPDIDKLRVKMDSVLDTFVGKRL